MGGLLEARGLAGASRDGIDKAGPLALSPAALALTRAASSAASDAMQVSSFEQLYFQFSARSGSCITGCRRSPAALEALLRSLVRVEHAATALTQAPHCYLSAALSRLLLRSSCFHSGIAAR